MAVFIFNDGFLTFGPWFGYMGVNEKKRKKRVGDRGRDVDFCGGRSVSWVGGMVFLGWKKSNGEKE